MEAWIVLGVGIATVLAQLISTKLMHTVADQQTHAAERQAAAAEAQVAASDAARERELAALLVATKGMTQTEVGIVMLHNGGLRAAVDVEVECLDGTGNAFASGRTPLVPSVDAREVRITLGNVELRTKFERCEAVTVSWTDGLGSRPPERLPLLAPV